MTLSCATDNAVSGFRDRPTQRIGAAIERMIASTDFLDGREIFMTPAMYWRYRILFPPELKARLRVATAEEAPNWWRSVCVDILSRWKPLPPPGEAYLLATPSQLAGQPECWDYGVGLPTKGLDAWQDTPPIARMSRLKNANVAPAEAHGSAREPILVLATAQSAERVPTEVATAGSGR